MLRGRVPRRFLDESARRLTALTAKRVQSTPEAGNTLASQALGGGASGPPGALGGTSVASGGAAAWRGFNTAAALPVGAGGTATAVQAAAVAGGGAGFYGKLALGATAAAASLATLKKEKGDEATGVESEATPEELAAFEELDLDTLPWRPQGRHVKQTVMAGQMLRSHPLGRLVSEQDHMFDGLQELAMVKDVRCYYDTKGKKYHCIVKLGDNVCGYPRTVHGGLTAALIDETFGGLYVSMLQRGALGPRLPGVTARLEVNYRNALPHNSVVMCTCELESVEGRKVWMKATMCNGDGTHVYAEARALFVAPSVRKSVKKWITSSLGL